MKELFRKRYTQLQHVMLHFSLEVTPLFWLLPRLGHVWKTLWHILSGGWEREQKISLYAFSPIDMRFRGWYEKIANDIHTRGRFGYIWDNGLGMSLADLTYNNWGTYTCLRLLGTRRHQALAFSLWLAVMGGMAVYVMGWPVAVFLVLFLGVSPAFVAVFTYLGKPETIAWGISLLAIYLLVAGFYVEAGLLWSCIALVNLPACLMVVIYAGPFGLVQSLGEGNLGLLLVAMLPGIVKTGMRLVPMWVSGAMKNLTDEQAGLWSPGWRLQSLEKHYLSLAGVALLIVVIMDANWIALTALVSCSAVYVMNARVIYYNDPQSTMMYLWMVAFCFVAASSHVWALLPLCAMLYPPLCYLHYGPLPEEKSGPPLSYMEKQALALMQYPCLLPVPYVYPAQLQKFYGSLPAQARIVAEFDGDPRRGSAMRSFWSWGDRARAERMLTLVNSIYLRVQDRALADGFFAHFQAMSMSGKQMDAVLKKLGASHVIVYSEATLTALVAHKYKVRFVYDLGQDQILMKLLVSQPRKMFVLEAPESRCVVGGARDLRIEGSTLVWTARENTTYQIRYRFLSGFSATLRGEPVELQTYKPFGEGSTEFMSVRAMYDGEMRLTYRAQIFPSFSQIVRKLRRLRKPA